MTALALLVRASLFAAALLLPALVLGRVLLGRQPGQRHAWLMAALLLAGAAPLWLALAGQLGGPAPIELQAWFVPEEAGSWLPGPAASVAPAGVEAPAEGRSFIPGLLLALWVAGVALALLRLARGLWRVAGLRRRARPHPQLAGVLLSDEVPAAVVVGLVRPTIVLAPAVAADPVLLAEVLAHERAHARRRDPLWGLVQRMLSALYWFHPLVLLTSRAISRAREEACDDAVLGGHPAPGYARTLLALATRGAPFPDAPGVLSRRGELERRIRRLFEARPAAGRGGRGALVLVAAAMLLAGGAGLALALAPPAPAEARAGTISERQAAPAERAAFALAGPGASGTFVMRDLDSGQTVVINPDLARQRVTPASTFKLVVALAGLESGVVKHENVLVPWTGQRGEMPGWNRDHTLKTAMATSANWYFQELLRQIDRPRLQALLAELHYGNQQLGADQAAAYMNGDLTISPLEQVEALSRIERGEVALSPATRRAMTAATHIETQGQAVILGKTGTATSPSIGTVAWLVGQVQRGSRRFAFATLLRAPESDVELLRQQRLPITRALLSLLGALPPAPVPVP